MEKKRTNRAKEVKKKKRHLRRNSLLPDASVRPEAVCGIPHIHPCIFPSLPSFVAFSSLERQEGFPAALGLSYLKRDISLLSLTNQLNNRNKIIFYLFEPQGGFFPVVWNCRTTTDYDGYGKMAVD